MKAFAVKTGKYKKLRVGCDYCGNPNEVRGYPVKICSNWEKTYLCKDCWGTVRSENKVIATK